MISFTITAYLVGALVGLASGAPASTSPSIRNSFIITLKEDISTETFASHVMRVRDLHETSIGRRDLGLTGIEKTFEIGDFHAYVGNFDDSMVEKIKSQPEVAHIEPDRPVYPQVVNSQEGAPWGLASVSSKSPGATTYQYDATAGEGTWAYVLDSGVNIAHEDFGGRAIKGAHCHDGKCVEGTNFQDDDGHGTHVAGTIGGEQFGVAKRANIVDVKVITNGSGLTSMVIAALEWVYNDARKNNRTCDSVVNMSLGKSCDSKSNECDIPFWGVNWAENKAVDQLFKNGILSVVAAGNENTQAAWVSPGSAETALTVGAVNQLWKEADFSNFGPRVDVLAPGVGIESADWQSTTGSRTMDGTSMAAPHVAGLALYLKSKEWIPSPKKLKRRIVEELSTKNQASSLKEGTQNRVAYNGIDL